MEESSLKIENRNLRKADFKQAQRKAAKQRVVPVALNDKEQKREHRCAE